MIRKTEDAHISFTTSDIASLLSRVLIEADKCFSDYLALSFAGKLVCAITSLYVINSLQLVLQLSSPMKMVT